MRSGREQQPATTAAARAIYTVRTLLCVLILAVVFHSAASAQHYIDSLRTWQRNYKEAFTEESHSPLKAADTGALRFFPFSKAYCVVAHVTRTPDSPVFDLPTHSGITKRYRQWGMAWFSLRGKKLSLRIYQSPDLVQKQGLEDHLSIFFNDHTNYEETYAGGRYLDFRTGDVRDGVLMLDFNKAYNPYCAYASGYNCPVPPRENWLSVRVRAGEKLFAGPHKE